MKDDQTIDMFNKENPLQQARRITLEKAKEGGATCPCCSQFVKVYRRTINSTMARQLITAYQKTPTSWFHTRSVVLSGSAGAGDFSKLEYWGLIERRPHKQGDDGKRTSGMWMLTNKGILFVKHGELVQKTALVYNGECLELCGPQINIVDALGKKFNYSEIMGWKHNY